MVNCFAHDAGGACGIYQKSLSSFLFEGHETSICSAIENPIGFVAVDIRVPKAISSVSSVEK